MEVNLISHTPDALDLLLQTKGTRLKHKAPPRNWTAEEKRAHLEYMRDTIKSSWEFVDYVFEFKDVTRVFTHQLVRTRTGSYAQESQRAVDASDHPILYPVEHMQWGIADRVARGAYREMVADGIPAQDARGILPQNVSTSIIAKFDLRTLHQMALVRLCTRTQGEYQEAFRAMRALVLGVHPWVGEHGFLEVQCVSTGTCAFPRYGQTSCPVWFPALDREEAKRTAAERFWSVRHVATPKAVDGKSSDTHKG